MSFIIQHKRRGTYIKHKLKPEFSLKRKRNEWKVFPTHDSALAVVEDMPEMEDCSIKPLAEVKK